MINVDKGKEGLDSAVMTFRVTRNLHYLAVPYFSYFQHPNQLQLAYVIRKLTAKKVGGLLRPFKSSEFGCNYNFAKSAHRLYWLQEFRSLFGKRLTPYYQQVFSRRLVEPCVLEYMYKSAFIMRYDLWKEEKTKLFRKSYVEDPDNYLYLKVINRHRKNHVDTDHASKLLMERSLNQEWGQGVKVGVKVNKPYDMDYLTHTLSVKASTEVTMQKWLKSKFFVRYMNSIRDIQFYSSLSGGYIYHPLH